ncbi:glycosyltransferase [Myxococcota bacterium]|nr:glycosyltransferase [Myxococcota bacterium]MBU1898860.1 glycosyltransferase [Myxococcota bacterium]
MAAAASAWRRVAGRPGRLLGWGNEGIVRHEEGLVVKRFYPDILKEEKARWLAEVLASPSPHVPSPQITRAKDGEWIATYPFEDTSVVERASEHQVREFLVWCLERQLVMANVKRSNFRLTRGGELQYIDAGNWIIPMDVSYFRDAAARLYSVFVLGNDDDELLRRPSLGLEPEIWETLPGFAAFFRTVLDTYARRGWSKAPTERAPISILHDNVSLLIKVCAMDAGCAREQVVHIVDQLQGPARFAERVIAVDPFEGPFVRQHTPGDLAGLMRVVEELRDRGWIDRVIIAPLEPQAVAKVNQQWFGLNCPEARNRAGVPISPQLWAFDQIQTRYVLQADVDVLIGRRDPMHDPISDMVAACAPTDVLGAAFNIPHAASTGWRDYFAAPGEFVPEVRLGLLDLERVRACQPLPNEIVEGRLALTWYRSLQHHQVHAGLRTVRGGDSRTFYIHPPNELKTEDERYHRTRDLIAQGKVPEAQLTRWDLDVPLEAWRYQCRGEAVVVYASGRNTTPDQVARFSRGLACQEDQTFGVIVVDDASEGSPRIVMDELAWLEERLTLIRTPEHQGRLPNLTHAVRQLITNPDTLIVVVDLDDALMAPEATRELRALVAQGHDMIHGAAFRPDAPTRLYLPNYRQARATFGGDVWMHLRSFKRLLFDQLSDEILRDKDGVWWPTCTDYATMVPMSEWAESPIFIPRYWYWHERSSEDLSRSSLKVRDTRILSILTQKDSGH